MTLEYLPADTQTRSIFGMLENGTAFDRSPLNYTNSVSEQMGTLGSATSAVPLFASAQPALAGMQSGAMSSLSSHIGDFHLPNMTSNLGLASSHISDSLGFGIGNAADPCAAMEGFFGSMMGGTSKAMANALSPMGGGIAGPMSGLMGGSMIGGLIQGSGVGTGVLNALGPLSNPDYLGRVLTNIKDPAAMMELGGALNRLGAITDISQFGNMGAIIGNVGLLSRMGQNLSGYGGMLPGISPTNLGSIGSIIGSAGMLTNQLGGIVNSLGGNMSALLGSMPTSISGAVNAAMSGALTGALGSLNGVMGGISSMVSGEVAAFANATQQLVNMALAINLPLLNSNPCAKAVLKEVGSDELNSALGNSDSAGSGGSGGSGLLGAGGTTSGVNVPLPVPRPEQPYGGLDTPLARANSSTGSTDPYTAPVGTYRRDE